MEKTEKIGLGIATAGHVLLFGLLSAGFLATPNPLKLNSPPMDVSLVDAVSLKSAAPQISTAPPPPSEAPEQGPTEDAAPAPAPEPAPAPKPEPVPAPPPPRPAPAKREVAKARPKPPAPQKAAEKPKPDKAKPAPAKSKPAAQPAKAKPRADSPAKASGAGKADRPRGSLLGKDFLKGIESEAPAPRTSATPAATLGPAQKSALDAEIRRQLKPHWKAPTGADADSLRTELRVQLSKDGAVIGTPQVIRQTGITPSNKAQAALHAEQAIKAVRLASPFKLPPQFYEQWKILEPLGFDRRLSQ
jgi:outer membrane biosynthesis protein TonB